MKISTYAVALVAFATLTFAAAGEIGNIRRSQELPNVPLPEPTVPITFPTNPPGTVKVEFWTSPRLDWLPDHPKQQGPNIDAIEILRKLEVGFGDDLWIDVNMYINRGTDVCPSAADNGTPYNENTKNSICQASCANNFRYCEPPPTDPVHTHVSGHTLVQEALRRQCLWNFYHNNNDVEEEFQFYDYAQHFFKRRCDQKNFFYTCIVNTMNESGVSQSETEACMKASGGTEDDVENTIFNQQIAKQTASNIDALPSLPAILINGVPLDGEIEQDAVFRAVCQAFDTEKVQDVDMCQGMLEEELGEDEDPEEAAKAEDELIEEIAEELGIPEDEVFPDEEAEEEGMEAEEEEMEEEGEEEWDLEKAAFAVLDGMSQVDDEQIAADTKDLEEKAATAAAITTLAPKSEGETQPVLEVWTTPLLDWDLATDKGDGPNVNLFSDMKAIVQGFGDKILFRPLTYIYSKEEVCANDTDGTPFNEEEQRDCAESNCVSGQRYCAQGPDDWKVSGLDLTEESLRRICLWQVYGRNANAEDDVAFFNYLAKFHESECDNTNYRASCISSVYSESNLNEEAVDLCIANSGGLATDQENVILESVVTLQKDTILDRGLNASHLPILLLDGEPVGSMDSLEDLVTLVCFKFSDADKPEACTEEGLKDLVSKAAAPAANGTVTTMPGHASVNPSDASTTEETQLDVTPEEMAAEVQAATTTPVLPGEAATTTPVAPEEAATTIPVIAAETSVPQVEALNSFGELGGEDLPEIETSAPVSKTTPTPPGPGEVGQVAELDALDMTLVNQAAGHLEALQKCEVDTTVLINKLKALGSGGQLKETAADIESDLPMLMSQTCPHDQGVEILHKLQSFQQCAMFDLQQLIETFPSTAVGVAMRCANAYTNMTKEEEESGFVPEDCIKTIEASSVLGRGIFSLYLYPDVACPCFEKLGTGIPECTADVWPIPINGALIKMQSCLVGQYCQSIDSLCEENMITLNECLPPRGTRYEPALCSSTFDKCGAIYDNLPPMLNAAPLPDACLRVAEGSRFYGQHVVERFDMFRHNCGQNMELWEGHSKVSEFKAFVTEGIYGIDYEGVPFMSGAAGGFFAGIVFTIVTIIFYRFLVCVCNCIRRWCCCCCGKKKAKRPEVKDYATVDTNGDDVSEYRD